MAMEGGKEVRHKWKGRGLSRGAGWEHRCGTSRGAQPRSGSAVFVLPHRFLPGACPPPGEMHPALK